MSVRQTLECSVGFTKIIKISGWKDFPESQTDIKLLAVVEDLRDCLEKTVIAENPCVESFLDHLETVLIRGAGDAAKCFIESDGGDTLQRPFVNLLLQLVHGSNLSSLNAASKMVCKLFADVANFG